MNNGGATITGYMIEYSVNEDFSSSSTADASTLSYTASGLANGTLYYFRVAAVNSAGTSAYHPGTPGTAVSAMPVVLLTISSISPTSGLVGATVMITGTGFSTTAAENTVTFLGEAGDVDNAVVMTVSAATATELTVTVPSSAVTGKIQVAVNSVMAVSSDDFTVLMSVPPTDTDADGLIDITTLAQLDAIRYDLDGDGRPTSAGQTAWQAAFSAVVTVDDDAAAHDGSSSFTGYELRNNLDFAGTKWENPTGGAFTGTHETGGWAPIGDFSNSYTATFDGRGHTISNLYINRPSASDVGLFGVLGAGSNVRNLGIEGGSVTGVENVGGLVGYNSGTISACYATGNTTGTGTNVGGLVGYNSGTISACYATGNTTGTGDNVGGLVGSNFGTISACYATGDATGTGDNVGGLVGENQSTIRACYATGDATGSSDVGGLVGSDSGTVTNSYFDSSVSNRTDSDSYDKTTTELQTPTAYAGIYANWNIDVDNGQTIGVEDGTAAGDNTADDPWDFGTDSEYPALRVDFNVNGTPTAFEFGGQGRAVPATVPDALAALTATAADAEVTLSWTAAASDGAPITGYMIEHDTDMNFPSPTTVPTAADATSHTVSGLTNGTPYYFRVAAVNSVGTGAYYPGATDAAVSATPVVPLAISSISPTSGLVGETVMITGTGFSATATDNTVVFPWRRR